MPQAGQSLESMELLGGEPVKVEVIASGRKGSP